MKQPYNKKKIYHSDKVQDFWVEFGPEEVAFVKDNKLEPLVRALVDNYIIKLRKTRIRDEYRISTNRPIGLRGVLCLYATMLERSIVYTKQGFKEFKE